MSTLQAKYPYYLNNKAVFANEALEVTDKYTGEVATRCALADAAAIDEGIAGAVRATEPMAKMPSYEKKAVLEHCVTRFKERFDELAMALCIEAGKPINDAEGEVTRLIDTFQIAAEESTRMHGELQALDISPRAKGYQGMWKRVPIGPCSFISPFNFPLNLAAHKIAPALAVGCPFVMKPASRTPLGAIIMGEVLAETDLPEGAFSILACSRDGADLFTVDDRLKLLSFTGSPGVGWDLKARCGKKKVVLELGGNAAVVVDADTKDLDDAVNRIIFGAFYQSGQSCIGVQRIMIHEDIYDVMKAKLVAKTATLIKGDPKQRETFIGPMISESEATRLHGWIDAAAAAGGTILCGGSRDGAMLDATLMENVPLNQDLCVEEAFGPAAVLQKFSSWDDAISMVNDSKFGLQAGIFTRDFYKVQQAWDEMEVGGVVVGDVPSYRVDNMPYGGVKDSGIGREGIVFAMEDMTEIRNLVIRTPPE
ncbi:MAG: aldehyde dehydrogenase family protein [Pseudomonadales bacterium]|jgi:acyl-CoA reductase-like NAD-dependent aldehyde dehydrogenase|nr:aldehyde dehydrogenase family protein [Gammaproteobacteria bacterium]MDA7771370.1 aldehyde dehydrogenase family protein [Pseudomonadales bacterium]MBT3899433.1 aldehyde dehydrogenase family protein [Gammaproteobacteria bacterium]MBT7537899.1 aldehyde dehydrogenase family protein [Gammaproteobacteria bacterium]MDA7833970.1 aldehyde dehydrogenase family protein [Pseudomonadales bacterium]|tara:strand:+ start:1975 stop:3417 length:1443 start_codon:yes stop_codon:yes gene_type:complete